MGKLSKPAHSYQLQQENQKAITQRSKQ